MKILIIEEDKYLQKLYLSHLSEEGFKVKIISPIDNFEKEIEKAEVIISNWKLKKWGISDSRFFLKKALEKNKKIIIITSHSDSQVPKEVPKEIREKCDQFFQKPPNWLKLKNSLLRIKFLKFKEELEELFEPL